MYKAFDRYFGDLYRSSPPHLELRSLVYSTVHTGRSVAKVLKVCVIISNLLSTCHLIQQNALIGCNSQIFFYKLKKMKKKSGLDTCHDIS